MIPSTDVRTTEVLNWRGLHLLGFGTSLCTRKVQIALALKGLNYTMHEVAIPDLRQPQFLGINPRGLVPVLVHDGAVVVESNDILFHLEAAFPSPALLPVGPGRALVQDVLDKQDGYHMQVRTLMLRGMPPHILLHARSVADSIDQEVAAGARDHRGGGQDRAAQREYYAAVAQTGFTEAMVASSLAVIRENLAMFEAALGRMPFLAGSELSLADVAVWVDVERLLAVAPELRLPEEFPRLMAAHRAQSARIGPCLPEAMSKL